MTATSNKKKTTQYYMGWIWFISYLSGLLIESIIKEELISKHS